MNVFNAYEAQEPKLELTKQPGNYLNSLVMSVECTLTIG
jgi:hypothetical protein